MKKVTTALKLIAMLGAYKPRVTVENELAFTLQKLRAKRRTRPLAGRGNWGKFLKEHFDSKAFEAKRIRAAKRMVAA